MSISSFAQKHIQKHTLRSGKNDRSLLGLNIAQSLGVMNDNMFKLLLIFLLIEVEGPERASSILSAAGALFVIPFLLFSPTAGVLADRFSKQRLILSMKIVEMSLLFIAIFSFGFRSTWGGYTLLFLLATHSALFSPSKYGIIPELVPSDKVSRANGIITACTYLAMIAGTFLASFLTDVTHRSFVVTVGVCFFFSIVGFIAACMIRKTPPQGSSKKFSPLFFVEVYRTLRFATTIRHLFISLCSAAFFLFMGAYVQLNIIPFAMEGLHLTDVDGGYLFLATAFGIAGGSYLAGKASKKRVELGLPCICAFAIAALLISLSITTSTTSAVIILILLGLFGGAFIVPFDTFTQLISPHEKRGQVIAAGSFLSFLGVLIASFAIYFFGAVGISAQKGFALVGILTLFVAAALTVRLSDLALPFFSRIFLHPILHVKSSGLELIEKNKDAVLILEQSTPFKALLLLGAIPQAHLFIPWRHNHRKHSLFYSITYIGQVTSQDEALKTCRARVKPQMTPCLLTHAPLKEGSKGFSFFGLGKEDVLYITVEKGGLFGWQITVAKEPKVK